MDMPTHDGSCSNSSPLACRLSPDTVTHAATRTVAPREEQDIFQAGGDGAHHLVAPWGGAHNSQGKSVQAYPHASAAHTQVRGWTAYAS